MAFFAGENSLVIASILILLVVSYDILTKELPVSGPITMAACRGANLVLGMSPSVFWAGIILVFPLISFIYVFALTTLSQYEVEGGLGGRGWVVSGCLLLVIFVISILSITQHLLADGLSYMGLLILLAGWPLLAGLLRPAPHRVGRAVKFLILGIPLLDAVYVSGIHGWAYGIPVSLCMVPSIGLSRYLYVT